MPSCCIRNCATYTGRTHGTKNIKYFTFPKGEIMLKKWIACLENYKINPNTARICEKHFKNECFEIKLTKDKSKALKRLKGNAFPTENMEIPRRAVRKKMNDTTCVKNNAENCIKTAAGQSTLFIVPSAQSVTENLLSAGFNANSNMQINEYQDQILKLQNECNRLKKENSEMQLKMIQQNKTNEQEIEEKIKERLGEFFALGQFKSILKPNNGRKRWTADDISSAISLRALSPKAYKYLRTEGKLSLPCDTTLRSWCSHFNVKPGLLHDVLDIMKAKGSDFAPEDKIVVLCFDEIYVSNKLDLERKQQQIYGSHQTCQFVMARGLFTSWKQPVFYQFDQRMTKSILFDIINALFAIEFTVVAITSDMGSTNMGLWKELEIQINLHESPAPSVKCFFAHPVKKNAKVFVFADVPHLIKLCRNNFLDSGFKIADKLIIKSTLEELIDLNKLDCKIAFKLTRMHLEVKGSQRQKVKLATQLFSNLNSKAIEFCGENGLIKSENWKETAYILKLVNDWFDLFNAQNKYGNHSGLNAYGLSKDEQNKLLSKMTEFMQAIRVGNNKRYLPFQKGIILCNESLKCLYEHLEEEFKKTSFRFEYILTRRLNQDILENFFSYLRSMGGTYDHPTPLEIQHRLKWYILGKHSGAALSVGENTEGDSMSSILINLNDENASPGNNQIELEEELLFLEENMNANVHENSCDNNSDVPSNSITVTGLRHYVPNCAADTIQRNGLKYIAGYVAHRFQGKFKNLGQPTESLPVCKNDWIHLISRGKCIVPTDDFFQTTLIMNECFEKFHGDQLHKGTKIFDTLTKIVCDTINNKFPYEVIHCLVRTRTYIRLRQLNLQITANNLKQKCNKKIYKLSNCLRL